MKSSKLAIILLLIPGLAASRKGSHDLEAATQAARTVVDQLAQNPPPEEAARLRAEKAAAVEKIEGIANAEPRDAETQLAVGKSLASVEEAPRAVPFAERGLKLAEASGDKALIREALLTSSEVFFKTGDYALARERAQRVLKDDPKDKDALALYMQVKDRGAAAASSAGPAAGGGASGSPGHVYGPGSTPGTRGPDVTMTSASALEAQKQIALGWNRIKLDPAAAMKNFEAAITADPRSAAVRVQRSKARLSIGNAPGALGDSDDAIALDPRLADGYAARIAAKLALGIKEEELLADLQAAANLDARYAEEYRSIILRAGGSIPNAPSASGAAADAASAPSGPRALLTSSPKGWAMLALIVVLSAALGGVVVPLMLRRRRSDEDGSLPR